VPRETFDKNQALPTAAEPESSYGSEYESEEASRLIEEELQLQNYKQAVPVKPAPKATIKIRVLSKSQLAQLRQKAML
jgi:hypothetical protein